MTPNSLIAASCSVTIALLISYGYLYLAEKKSYILTWIMSLSLLLIAYLSRIIMIETGREYTVLLIINFTSTITGYWLISRGTNLFFGKKISLYWTLGAGLLVFVYSVLTILQLPTGYILLVSVSYTAALLVMAGLTCFKASSPQSSIRMSLGYTYCLWAAASLIYPLTHILKMIPTSFSYLLIGAIGLIAFITIQAMYFQSIREDLEIKEANIRRLMVYDKLTGAYSRAYFEQILDGFFDRFTLPAVIVMGDFNGLKLINDTFGHEKGDELLVDGVRIMQATIGEENAIVRWGGDEFIIIMPDKVLSEAIALIRKIKTALKSFRTKTIPLDISFGLAIIGGRDQVISEVIKQAEDMMYTNKLNESKKTRLEIVEFLEKLLWEKDYQTEEHVMRLKGLVDKIGRAIGLSAREIVNLTQVAMLHDIGKIGVPVEILNKPGELTSEEWSLMKKHSEIGYRITQASGELAHISEAILAHHEWWDGNGYPQGLQGEEIPLFSRIVSIVDSYDVMTHERPYKRTMNAADALAEIRKWAGIQFDPYLVSVFIEVMQDELVMPDESQYL